MLKNVIIIVLFVFVLLYAVQQGIIHACEVFGERTVKIHNSPEPVHVRIMLGPEWYDKYIPGLGVARVFTDGPFRLQVDYVGQRFTKPLEKRDDVDLDKIRVFPQGEKIYVEFKVKFNQGEQFVLKRERKKEK